jgi:CheY-like chemotaxis protein
VVFLSAHAQETDRQAAMAAGAKYFLAKPYDSGKLFVAIEAAIGGTDEVRIDALARDQTNPRSQTA